MDATALLHLIALLALGAVLGYCGGLFGIGGGIIAIPLMVIAFGMDQSLAQGTALVMMVPNLVIAWWRYNRRHPAPWGAGLGIALLGSLTTWITARFATALHPEILRHLFSLFLFAIAVWMLWRRPHPSADAPVARVAPRWIPLVGVVGGSAMGLLGIGGGLVATPLLAGLFGQRQTMAQSLALALVTPSSLIALAAYGSSNKVDWALGLPLAVGGLFTVSTGVALAHRLPERRMRRGFYWMLLATSLWLPLSRMLTG